MPRGISRSDEALFQGRLWTPRELRASGLLVGWYDATDIGTIETTSGVVSTWRDKSGFDNHLTQSSSAHRPSYSPNGLAGGYPGVIFATSPSTPRHVAKTSFVGLSGLATVYVVGYMTNSSTTNARLASFADNAGEDWSGVTGGVALYRSTTTATLAAFASNAASTASGTFSYGVPFIAGGYFNASTMGVSLNGTAAATTAVAARTFGASTRFGLGVEWDNAGLGFLIVTVLDGAMAEAVVCKNETALDRLRIEGHLAWKWGRVENLPASHLFKTRPPLIGA